MNWGLRKNAEPASRPLFQQACLDRRSASVSMVLAQIRRVKQVLASEHLLIFGIDSELLVPAD